MRANQVVTLSITQLPLTLGSNEKDDTSPPARTIPSFEGNFPIFPT